MATLSVNRVQNWLAIIRASWLLLDSPASKYSWAYLNQVVLICKCLYAHNAQSELSWREENSSG